MFSPLGEKIVHLPDEQCITLIEECIDPRIYAEQLHTTSTIKQMSVTKFIQFQVDLRQAKLNNNNQGLKQ